VEEEMGEHNKGNHKQREREREFVVHMHLLDEKVIERMVVEKKKHELLIK
jgi:pre-mRNA-splicing factor ISY1